MAKKVSRKQLLKKPDEFITFTGKTIQQIVTYQKQIFIAVGIVLAVVVIFSLMKFFTNRAENKAFTLLSQANSQYQSLLENMGPAMALREVEKNFDQILNEYSTYQSAHLARFYYANYSYKAGEYDKAVELYTKAREYFKDEPIYLNLILSGLGHSYEAKKDHEKSAEYFQMILSSDIPLLKDEALFNLGKSYDVLGREAEKNDAYKTLISDYPDSIYTPLVKDQMAFSG
jgi:tetratricopeptide (TPR) repeat protein